MAVDEGMVEAMRADIGEHDGITEVRMFGGICFMLNGNMVAGIHKDGAMYRVGKDREAQALALDGARPMNFTGRIMRGFVDVGEDAFADDDRRAAWTGLALAHAASLPPK